MQRATDCLRSSHASLRAQFGHARPISSLPNNEPLDALQLSKIQTDFSTYAALLRCSGNSRALSDGRRIHNRLVKRGIDRNALLGNLVLQMYGSCGALEDTCWVFNSMQKRDQFSWNFMIRAHAQHGQASEARQLFDEMQREGVRPDKHIVVGILSAYSSQAALDKGKLIHACICESVYDSDIVVGNALVNMYGKCGSLEDARSMFDRMSDRDTVTWTVMVAAYTQCGRIEGAFLLFDQMEEKRIRRDEFTFTTILSACVDLVALPESKHIHKSIVNSEFETDVAVGNALLNMYSKCGSVEDAERMFYKMITRNDVTWTAMVTAYVQHGCGRAALELFGQMQHVGLKPNRVTFISILSACASKEALADGKRLHACIITAGFESDAIVNTALVTMYGKCNDLEEARKAFDKMNQHTVPSWNAMIAVYGHHGQSKNALQLLCQMLLEGELPDKLTFIGAITGQMALAEGKTMHTRIIATGFESDISVANALVNMYGKCGSLQDARMMFYRMPEWDKVTYVNILYACASQAALAEGKQIHMCIIEGGFVSDIGLANALVHMYCKCCSLQDACRVFESMLVRDCTVWSVMIAAYAQCEQGQEAIQLFDQMQKQGTMPDKVTFIAALCACASRTALAEGRRMHAQVVGSGMEADSTLGNALVDMYSKCGSLLDARRMFDRTHDRDTIAWTTMIAALGEHEEGKDALFLFYQMQQEGMMPNKATFVSGLSACASGSASEGKRIHAFIVGNGLESDLLVGTALVNMYGKCGNLEDATRVFGNVPEQTSSWNAMIGVYSQHGQCNLALKSFARMQEEGVMPDKVTFVSILSACSHTGLVDDCCQIFVFMISNCFIIPISDHYNCMIDLFGRAGQLDLVQYLIKNIPLQPSFVSWMTFLGACNCHVDVEHVEHVAKHLFELNVDYAAF